MDHGCCCCLREKAQALHAALVTTPEICQRLGLGLDAVMALLLPAPPPPTERRRDMPQEVVEGAVLGKRPVGRPPWSIEKEDGARLLSRLVGHGNRKAPIWTLPQLVGELREVLPSSHPLSPDTVRRRLDRLGLTFEAQAEGLCSTGRLFPRCGKGRGREILYLVTHRTTRQLGFGSPLLPPATVVVGLTPGNRVAIAVRMQSRITPKFLQEFLDGLSNLHPNRRVVAFSANRLDSSLFP